MTWVLASEYFLTIIIKIKYHEKHYSTFHGNCGNAFFLF